MVLVELSPFAMKLPFDFTSSGALDPTDYVQTEFRARTGGNPNVIYVNEIEFTIKRDEPIANLIYGPRQYDLYYAKTSDFSDQVFSVRTPPVYQLLFLTRHIEAFGTAFECRKKFEF